MIPRIAGSRFNFCKRHNGFSRGACIRSAYSLWFEDCTPPPGDDGEDYRANFVHAPFSEHPQHAEHQSRSRPAAFQPAKIASALT